MPAAVAITGVVWEDSGASLMGRVLGNAGTAIVQADMTGISRSVYLGDTVVAGPTAIVVATAVFDTLQTDARWTTDSTGYNFRDDAPETIFADSDRIHIVEYALDPASGEDFHVVFRVTIAKIRTS